MNTITRINQDFDPGLLLLIVRRSFIWIVLIFILSVVIGFLYLRWTPLEFEATSVIQLTTNNQQSSNLFELSGEFYKENLSSEIELIKSPVFLQRVIDRLPLEITYLAKGRVLNSELYSSTPFVLNNLKVKNNSIYGRLIELEVKSDKSIFVSFEVNRKKITSEVIDNIISNEFFECEIHIKDEDFFKQKQEYLFIFNNPQNLFATYSRNLNVEILNPNANSIKITFRDNNNKKTADFVNAIAKEYEYFYLNKKQESANKVIAYIDDNLQLVSDLLFQTDTSISGFKKRHGLNNFVDFESLNNIKTIISEIETEILGIQIELDILNQLKKVIESNKELNPFEILSVIYGTPLENRFNTLVQGIIKIIESKEESYFSINEKGKITQRIDYILELRRKQLLMTVDLVSNSLKRKEKVLEEKARELAQRIKFESDTINGKKFNELTVLERAKSVNEKYYNSLVDKKAELTIAKEGYIPDYNILAFAQVPLVPIKPNKSNVALYSLGAWLIISLSIITIRYLFHDEIINVSDVAKYTECGLLGVVHKYNEEIPVSQLIVDKRPKSRFAESFRAIRSNMQFISNKEGPKIISVTSTIPGEGKTFITINLAGIIAYAGKKVIIIDTDLRKPRIHLGFNTSNEIGISTLLIGASTLDESVKHSSLENLDYITAGPIPPNPSELIMSDQMEALINQLKEKYDYVVIDNPPSGLVSDSIINMVRADYPIYVIRSNYSRKFFINNLNYIAKENKLKNMTYILNGYDPQKGRGYGYGSYGFSNYEYGNYNYGNYGNYGGYSSYGSYINENSGYYEDDEKIKKSNFLSYLLKSFRLKK